MDQPDLPCAGRGHGVSPGNRIISAQPTSGDGGCVVAATKAGGRGGKSPCLMVAGLPHWADRVTKRNLAWRCVNTRLMTEMGFACAKENRFLDNVVGFVLARANHDA